MGVIQNAMQQMFSAGLTAAKFTKDIVSHETEEQTTETPEAVAPQEPAQQMSNEDALRLKGMQQAVRTANSKRLQKKAHEKLMRFKRGLKDGK